MSNWAYPQKVSEGKNIRSVALACWACDPAHNVAITTKREIRFINPPHRVILILASRSQLKLQNSAALYMWLRRAREETILPWLLRKTISRACDSPTTWRTWTLDEC